MIDSSHLSASHIRYLLALKKLNSEKGIVSADIAKTLKLSRVSVHKMMEPFLFLNYITTEPGSRVFMTEYGLKRATVFEHYYKIVCRKLFSDSDADETAEMAIYAFLAELSEESLALLDRHEHKE